MNISDPIAYRRLLQPFQRALTQLRLDLDFYLEEVGPIILVSIEHRLKAFDSAIEKSQRMKIPIQQLNDLAGLRVVVGTEVDIDSLRHFFANGLPGTSFTVLKDNKVEHPAGYRAHHVVIETFPNYAGNWRTCHIEIQLQTALESAFNKLSRQWIYKAERRADRDWQERFVILSQSLKDADRVASTLHRELFSAQSGVLDADILTPLAYQTIVKEAFDETTEFDNAVWHCVFYARSGITTCGELRQFFNRADLAAQFQECMELLKPDDIWGFSMGSKQEFWETWGTRPSALKKLIEHQRNLKKTTGD